MSKPAYVEDFDAVIQRAREEQGCDAVGFLVRCSACREHGEGLRAIYLQESWELLLACARCAREVTRVQVRSRKLAAVDEQSSFDREVGAAARLPVDRPLEREGNGRGREGVES